MWTGGGGRGVGALGVAVVVAVDVGVWAGESRTFEGPGMRLDGGGKRRGVSSAA